MRTAIFSDIHGNLEALEAVLEACRTSGVEEYVCLGDLVGYGASPNACVERVRGLAEGVVAGNHDHAAVGLTDLSFFNPIARVAAAWTARQLTPENAGYLRGRPMTIETEDAVFAHATPGDPGEWNYVFDAEDAEACLAQTDRQLCFVGHSHVAFVCVARGRARGTVPASPVEEAGRYVINVGSVGQPRDLDPRAAFALWDRSAREIRIVRVDYDIAGARARILEAGLPYLLAERLTFGR